MRRVLIASPGVLGAAVIWHIVVNCKPYKIMSSGVIPLGFLALAVGVAICVAMAVRDDREPNALWCLASSLAGPGCAYAVAAIPTAYLARSEGDGAAYRDFSWDACLTSLGEGLLQALSVSIPLAVICLAILGIARLVRFFLER